MRDEQPGADQAERGAIGVDSVGHAPRATGPSTLPTRGAVAISAIPKLGLWAWTFIGLVVTLIIMATVLAAVNEIVLPVTFAAVLAIIFKPAATRLTGHRVKPAAAAGIVVLGLRALVTVVMVATVQGVIEQLDQIGTSVDSAVAEADTSLGLDQATSEEVRAAVAQWPEYAEKAQVTGAWREQIERNLRLTLPPA